MAAGPVKAETEACATLLAPFDVLLREISLPITIQPARPLDDRELLAFCEANSEFEIESDADGSLRVMSPNKAQGSYLNQLLNAELTVWARQNSGIVFGPDLGVRFPDRVMRGPDCAWLPSAKWERLDEEEREKFLAFCPEFIAELRSSTDRASKVEAKMEFWMSRGAELGWLVDPRRKLAMIYRAGQEPETLLRPDWLMGEGPLAGFRLRMDEFWR